MAIYLMAIAEMNGIDLDAEVEQKITKNAGCVYQRDASGPTRIAEGSIPEAMQIGVLLPQTPSAGVHVA